MAAGVIFMQWSSYVSGTNGAPFFSQDSITFNTRQDRLHRLAPADRLWLVSRCPDDGQYYFAVVMEIERLSRNPPGSEKATRFGEYAIIADRSQSHDLGRRFPAEALLRAFTFETDRPIGYGASIGQSLQTLRLLNSEDEHVLDAAVDIVQKGESPPHAMPCALWTKCDSVFAEYFVKNWTRRPEPLAFLLYDPPPALRPGSPIFIHSDKNLRLLARFREGQFVAGHKLTVEAEERVAERERVWHTHRVNTIEPPTKEQFDKFWQAQNGVRGLFVMDQIVELTPPMTFKLYGRALQWGYPMGVGYRYLSLAQSLLLLKMTATTSEVRDNYLRVILDAASFNQRLKPAGET